MKKNYKAIITDYDNTLAGFHQKIDETLRRKIVTSTKNGLIFTIATGRAFTGIIQEMCTTLKLTSPQIVMGGALIINPVNQSVLWEELIPANTVRNIARFLDAKNLYSVIETPLCDYSSDGEFVFFFPKKVPVKKISEMPFEPVAKILVVAYKNNLDEKKISELEKQIKSDNPGTSVIKFLYEGQWGLDITSGRATKHTAVLEYMKLLKLDPEEVVGIGDNFNDYPLLTACGLKIAMADAPKELIEIADFVAPAQKDGGFLVALNRFF